MLAKTLNTPGTLVIHCSGEHAKHGDEPSASGKVFNQKQQDLAATFSAAGGRTAKNLRVALLAGGCSEASLPTNTQLSNWLKNARQKKKGALEKDQHIVAAVGLEVAALPRALPKQIDALFLLADPVITDAEVCVLFACPGMLNTFNRFAGDAIALAVDTKMKVLDRGMGVATVSLLVKDRIRPTHLTRAGKGCRTQGHAWTSHGMPILQAIFHAETKPNYVRLFACVCDVWRQRCAHRQPLEEQKTLQVHKDFHPSIEEARREIFPHSRACDDFFHMREKSHTVMQSTCAQVVLRKGKYIKKNAVCSRYHLHPTVSSNPAIV